MYCEKCGAVISDDANFCKVCGSNIDGAIPRQSKTMAKPEENDAVVSNDVAETVNEIDPKTGRPGIPWPIIIFCLAACLAPLSMIYGFNDYIQLYENIGRLQFGTLAVATKLIVDLMFVIGAVFVAYSVWQVKNDAIKFTKIYLLASPVANLTSYLAVAYMPSFDFPVVAQNWQAEVMKYAMITLVFDIFRSGLWYSYFSLSKKVAAAYGIRRTWMIE